MYLTWCWCDWIMFPRVVGKRGSSSSGPDRECATAISFHVQVVVLGSMHQAIYFPMSRALFITFPPPAANR